MAREYFRSRVEKDVAILFKVVVWVFITALASLCILIIVRLSSENFDRAVRTCVETKGYSEEYCKFLAK